MTDHAITVLVVSNDRGVVEAIRVALCVPGDDALEAISVASLADALTRMAMGGVDAILIDPFLPDSQGIDSFDEIFLAARRIPILVLTAGDDEGVALQAVERGAKDRILKEEIDPYSFGAELRHILARVAVEDALFAERQSAQITLNSIGDGVISIDVAGNVTYLNAVAERMTGWARGEAAGRSVAEVFCVVDGDTREVAPNPMRLPIGRNRTGGLPHNALLVSRDGLETAIEDSIAPIHNQDGEVTGRVMVFRDVSQTRMLELKLSHLAQHDTLTNLPNRMLLIDRLTQAIVLARRHGKSVAVLFVDLDRFKHINDSLGHAIGDRLLQSVAGRLTVSIRNSDTVSRFGGDEFVIVLSEVERAEDAARHAVKIHASVTRPHMIEPHELHVNASIGISIFPDDGDDPEMLIQCADIAMFHAKESGRNTHQFFRPDMNVRAAERQSLEAGLRRALKQREFVLHYQAQTNLETGAVTGAEALVRWVHPERGLLAPRQFLPAAEQCGLIVPLGQWVLREACRQAGAWQKSGLRGVSVAVNVSALEFRHQDFLATLPRILASADLDARDLELEVTESVLMEDLESNCGVLQSLKSIGVRVAVDKFGSGFSNLGHLGALPIDTLKIDQRFVHEISTVPGDASMVSAIVGLGRTLGLRVVAQGVETHEQQAFLQSRLCDHAQGYLFSRPMVAESLADALRAPVPSRQVTALSAR